MSEWEPLTEYTVEVGAHMLPVCLKHGHRWHWRPDIADYACGLCRVLRALCEPTDRDRVELARPAGH